MDHTEPSDWDAHAAPPGDDDGVVLRRPRPGELGWIVQRHGALYAREHGWNERFEALVASVVADFGSGHDPRRERCWIAEVGGEPAGCVMVVAHSAAAAKLRLLLVEPHARGRGVGALLIAECVRFARAAGYRRLTLWTTANLLAARRLYAAAGFRLVHREEEDSDFGGRVVNETWELDL